MIAISPAQAMRLGAEIYKQACQLDVAADDFRAPWGTIAADRLRRLSDERFAACGAKRNPMGEQ
jgi:hypothetical protein